MMQRTTIAADEEDLDTLRREAERRAVPFTRFVAAVLSEKAAELRRASRPRFGLGSGGGGLAVASVEDEAGPAHGDE